MQTVQSVPIYSPKTCQPPQGSIGVSRSSPFLDALKAQKRISSRTWSLFWGWQGMKASQQMKGKLVPGGSDRAKIKGDNFTREFVNPKKCSSGLMVYVKRIHIITWFCDERNVFDSSGTPSMHLPRKSDIHARHGLIITVPNHQLVLPNVAIIAIPKDGNRQSPTTHGSPQFSMPARKAPHT
ncbi:hypothetical protein PAAG_05280 [Paracoccidioides lutzii Pb01]|uniref:Uncharacterized protein n=1 Tax=Paracoccidioides lutzii (strain ATCC MYA-826 / Pb01) TaxID=502779 RepID=C1H3D7_PARBA|nr:hypothetical protein PAAG_05280 [Paracoccidioides lutzii Pb01]EEH34231.2 hypothetical protein PAAG_05280 [Paracoccidioides lutzii Pb01]